LTILYAEKRVKYVRAVFCEKFYAPNAVEASVPEPVEGTLSVTDGRFDKRLVSVSNHSNRRP
jgi:hypothetical protein